MKSVAILALDLVVYQLIVMSQITFQYVLVFKDILVIHSQIVTQHQHQVRYKFQLTFENVQYIFRILLAKEPVLDDPCDPSPCGPNANCNNGVCTCLPEYRGDPYSGCRPECVLNSDCSRDKACLRSKCVDPCPGTCGQNAICDVINHVPMCSCPTGMAGNAFVECRPYQSMYNFIFAGILSDDFTRSIAPIDQNPCNPSPCGQNSQCREINGQAVCSCIPGYIGSPPTCRPECTVNSDCPQNEACSNQKCRNPCLGTCGISAKCTVVNHNPICSCPPRLTGDPFIRCQPISKST
jgi:hypothetical protein